MLLGCTGNGPETGFIGGGNDNRGLLAGAWRGLVLGCDNRQISSAVSMRVRGGVWYLVATTARSQVRSAIARSQSQAVLPLQSMGGIRCRPRAYGHLRTMEIGVSAGESALRPWIPALGYFQGRTIGGRPKRPGGPMTVPYLLWKGPAAVCVYS